MSRLHAELTTIGSEWIIVDDGLSRNGTFANGEPVAGRRRLSDGDQVEVGATPLIFREPARHRAQSTAVTAACSERARALPRPARVLVALCRPFGEGAPYAAPATNQQIAEELHLSVAAVKTHLRALFQRFGIGDLQHNEKRLALVQAALDKWRRAARGPRPGSKARAVLPLRGLAACAERAARAARAGHQKHDRERHSRADRGVAPLEAGVGHGRDVGRGRHRGA